MKQIKTAGYNEWFSAVDALARKVITRVVSDGQDLKSAIREAIKIAELNKQDVFYLLSRLQDFGMIHNGDYKNYWSTGLGLGIGPDSIEAVPGTNYFASNKSPIKTADLEKQAEMFQLFESVNNLRTAGITDEDILNINPEMKIIIDSMNEVDKYETAELDEEFLTKQAAKIDPLRAVSIFQSMVLKAYKDFKDGKFDSFEESMKYHATQNDLQSGANLKRIVDIVRRNYPQIPEYESSQHYLNHRDRDTESVLKPLAEKAKIISQKNQVPFEDAFHFVSKGNFPKPNWRKLLDMIGLHGFSHEDVIASSNSRFVRQAQATPETAPAAVGPAAAAPAAAIEAPPQQGQEIAEEAAAVPEESSAGEEVNVQVTPSPSELIEAAKQGPEWDIKNMLSLTKAQKYYESLKEQLENVVYNENLMMDLSSVEKYDKVRSMIDAELEKIDQAVKGKKKIENKEQELEENVEEKEIPENAPSATPEMPSAEVAPPVAPKEVQEEPEVSE